MNKRYKLTRENITAALEIYRDVSESPKFTERSIVAIVDEVFDNISAGREGANLRLGYRDNYHAKFFVSTVNLPTGLFFRKTQYVLGTDPNTVSGEDPQTLIDESELTRERILTAWEQAGFPTRRKFRR